MTLLRHWARPICGLLLLLLPLPSYAEDSQSRSSVPLAPAVADEVIPTAIQLYRDYIEKSGGLAHLAELNSIKFIGHIDIVGDERKHEVSVFRKRPNKSKTKVDFQNYVIETIFDGKEGVHRYYDTSGDLIESIAIVGEALETLRQTSILDGVFRQIGDSLDEIKLITWDEVDEIPAVRIDLVEGNQLGYDAIWLDKETLQECKLRKVLRDSETGEERIEETYFVDMDQVEGYYFPRKSRTSVNGELKHELLVERIRVNSGIYDSFFKIR